MHDEISLESHATLLGGIFREIPIVPIVGRHPTRCGNNVLARNEIDPLLAEWARNFEAKFDTIASAQALSAYRNARLFVAVLARVGRTPTQANFRHALETLGPWTDPLIDMPPIIFSAENHQGLHDVFLAQVQGGRWVIVAQISPTRL